MPNPANGLQDATTGRLTAQKGSDGRGHTRPQPGPKTSSRNRELNDVSTRQSVTWTEAENVTEVTITVISAAGTAAVDDGAFVVFDATSDALANTWLTEGSYTSTNSYRYFIPLNVPRRFEFTDNITRADFLYNADGGSTAYHIIVEAH